MNGELIKIIIPKQPITKKRHQQIAQNNATGRRIVIPLFQYLQFKKQCLKYLNSQYRGEVIDYPINIKCLYYMGTRRKIDLTNLMEATHDILVNGQIIKDDNSKIIDSVDGSRVLYDKANPRTEIYIEKLN